MQIKKRLKMQLLNATSNQYLSENWQKLGVIYHMKENKYNQLKLLS